MYAALLLTTCFVWCMTLEYTLDPFESPRCDAYQTRSIRFLIKALLPPKSIGDSGSVAIDLLIAFVCRMLAGRDHLSELAADRVRYS